jgi:5-methylcytosine-specific restriction endonuclease McrBC regulatory subunit McrC
MEALFESYVVQVLTQAARRTPFKISAQKGKHFWRGENRGLKTVRPDIIVDFEADSKKRRVVLDTKWKLPKNHLPSDGDLKQMFVYNKLFKAQSSNLVYPAVTSSINRKGAFVGEGHGNCSMWFIPILNPEENKLNPKLGESILSQVMGS